MKPCWIINYLPNKFKWSLHNLIGHPMKEICYWFGYDAMGDWIHDYTLPGIEFIAD